MTEKNGPGQASKKAADDKTAQVAGEKVDDATEATVGTDQAVAREDDAPARAEGRDASYDPFPDYDSLSVDELASLAESRNVEINRDVEKAELIKELRADDSGPEAQARSAKDAGSVDNPYASYDVTPLEVLRNLAESRGVELSEEFRRAHYVTELRAADTSGGVSVAFKKSPVTRPEDGTGAGGTAAAAPVPPA